MSDRLDIVRIIDAKVTATRRTIARSRQTAEAAKNALQVHEDWIRQYHERADGDFQRHRYRVKRRERHENNKRFATAAFLFLPRLVGRLGRSGVFGLDVGLRKASNGILAGCLWLAGMAQVPVRPLARFITKTAVRLGSQAQALALIFAAALRCTFSWLGQSVRAAMRALLRPATGSLSRLGRQRRAGGAERRTARLMSEVRPPAQAPENKRSGLDTSRLDQAMFIRLRAEHDRLQARIHAMDRHYRQRASRLGGRSATDWVELRKLALNARKLFELQERQMRGPAALCASGLSLPSQKAEGRVPKTRIRTLHAGRAIYEAPALFASARRA